MFNLEGYTVKGYSTGYLEGIEAVWKSVSTNFCFQDHLDNALCTVAPDMTLHVVTSIFNNYWS